MKKILNIFTLLLAISGLSSCVKEDPFFDPEDTENIIEFLSAGNVQSPATAPYPLFINSYPATEEVDMPIVVSYSGPDVAPSDITLTIGVGTQSILDTYNDAQETHYDLLPANLYTLPATVVIPRGERRATYTVKIKTSQFDFSKSYALPLTITNASTGIISGNFGTAIFAVGAKNKYDGNYTVTATAPMVDRTNATLTGFYPLDSDLVTVGPNSVKMFCYTYLGGLEGHPIKSGTASSYYGDFAPVFTMDNDGKVISVTNFWGEPAGNGRSARLNPSGVNKFTVNTDGSKVLEVSYVMQQAGRVDRTFFQEKWTFVAER